MIESFTLRAEAQRFISHSGTVHRLLHLCQDSRVVTLCHALCTPGAQKDAPIGGDQPFITPWSLFHQTRQSDCRLSLAKLWPRSEHWQPGGWIQRSWQRPCFLGPVRFYQHSHTQPNHQHWRLEFLSRNNCLYKGKRDRRNSCTSASCALSCAGRMFALEIKPGFGRSKGWTTVTSLCLDAEQLTHQAVKLCGKGMVTFTVSNLI